MKIIVVNDYAERSAGGASAVAIAQAESMAKRGHEVHFLSALPGPRAVRNGVQYEDCDQHDILGNPNRLQAMALGIWNPITRRRLSELISRLGTTDLVCHVHSWTKSLSSSVIPAAREHGVPILFTLHDSFVACPTGSLYDFQLREPCKLQPMSLRCMVTHCDPRNRAHKLWRVLRQAVQSRIGDLPGSIDRLMAVSTFSRKLLSPYVPDHVPFVVVPSAISMPRWTPVPLDQREGAAFVGRLSPEKGALLYAAACREGGISPYILGSGDLADQVRELCPDARISGWLEQSELRRRLASARLLVLPTRAYEAQPLSVLEAAALGVPFVVSAHCAASDYVRDSGGGLLLHTDNPAELAELMNRLLTDDALAEELGRNAYNWFWSSDFADSTALDDLLEQQYRAARDAADARAS